DRRIHETAETSSVEPWPLTAGSCRAEPPSSARSAAGRSRPSAESCPDGLDRVAPWARRYHSSPAKVSARESAGGPFGEGAPLPPPWAGPAASTGGSGMV